MDWVRQMVIGVGNAGCGQVDNLIKGFGQVKRNNGPLAEKLNISFEKIIDDSDLGAQAIVECDQDNIVIIAGVADCVLAGKTAAAWAAGDNFALRIGILIDEAGKPVDDNAVAEFMQNVDALLVLSEQEVRQIDRFLFSILILSGGGGLISIDYADIRHMLNNKVIEFAVGSTNDCSEKRGEAAAQAALQAILAKMSLDEIEGLILGVWGDEDLSMMDIADAADYICHSCKEGTEIIFGAGYVDGLAEMFSDKLSVVLIATRGK